MVGRLSAPPSSHPGLPEAAETTATAVRDIGCKALALSWDIADLAVIGSRVTTVEKALGPVDILVNITSGPPPTPAADQAVALWKDDFESMVLSVIAITDRILPHMRTRRWGRIITSTSSVVIAPIPTLAISNSLRLSLVGWSKTLSQEVGLDGITVNVVLPGRIATQRIAFLDEQKSKRQGRSIEEIRPDSTASIPLGRYGDPQEYADVITFLASSRASYVTGSIIRVDGGLIQSI